MSVVLTGLQVIEVRPGEGFFFANNGADSGEGVLCLRFKKRRLASDGKCPRFTQARDGQTELPNEGDGVVCEVVRGYRGRWFAVAWTTREAWEAAATSQDESAEA